jgi:hypothetical protein
MCASAPERGESVFSWDPDRFTLFRAAADPGPGDPVLVQFGSRLPSSGPCALEMNEFLPRWRI